MLKKLILFLMVASLLAGVLSACGGSSADNDATKLLKSLNDKARVLINQPGWVHVTENIVYDTDNPDRGTLSTGQAVPLVQTVDIWYHINEEKLVYQYVWMMSTKDGETIEVSVFLNNMVYNLTTNVTNPLNPYTLNLDYQFSDEMDSFISRNGHPLVSTADVNGKTATVFTLNEQLDSPRTVVDFAQGINAAGSIAFFDTETGLLLKREQTVTLADGTKRTFFTDNVTIETGVQPTLEVQDYVNGFW
jgi:hypothetical protein